MLKSAYIRYVFFPLLFAIIASCQTYPESTLYFDYDELEHYQIDISNSQFLAIATDSTKSELDERFIKAFTGFFPERVSDPPFL